MRATPDGSGPYDALIVGGGPAGSTAAAVLAMHGRRALVLEKTKFPRYHIGESLMPYCYFPLERVGVIDRIKASRFPKKYSVQFVTQEGKAPHPFYFHQHFDHPASTTWQVVRGEFDQMLLENARAKGAEVREETRVTELIRENDAVVGVRAVSKSGDPLEFRAPITLDASGLDALSVNRRRWRVFDEKLRKVAIWTYYQGSVRDPGQDEGATTVAFLPKKGWFWYIPLPDDVVSVGIVADAEYLYAGTRDPAAIFDREKENNPWIKAHLAPGRRVPGPGLKDDLFCVTREWSWRSTRCAEDGLVLSGDALGFLDPVFSSGVFLALKGGEMAGDAIHAALQAGDVSASRFAAYGERMAQGIEAMRRLVYAFYDPGFSMRALIARYPKMRGDVTDCLIGNLFRDFSELFAALGKFAELPEKPLYGTPAGS